MLGKKEEWAKEGDWEGGKSEGGLLKAMFLLFRYLE